MLQTSAEPDEDIPVEIYEDKALVALRTKIKIELG